MAAGFAGAQAVSEAVPDQKPSQSTDDETVQMRLRISWGGGSPTRWRGFIRFPDATISDPAILGMSADSSAAIKVRRQSIEVRQLTESVFAGVDISVDAHSDSLIEIEWTNDGQPESKVQEIHYSDLIRNNSVVPLDEQNNRLTITRAPGDMIQFLSSRDHMIFGAAELFPFMIRGNLLPWSDAETECRLEIFASRSTAPPVFSKRIDLRLDKTGSTPWEKLSLPVPTIEGVYDLRMTLGELEYSRMIPTQRLPSVTRTVQFVVLDHQATATTPSKWQTISEIDPGRFRLSIPHYLNQFSQLIGIGNQKGPVGRFDTTTISDTKSVTLPVGGWQAIPLNIPEPKQPYLLEIEFDSNQRASIGFSILEVDESGQVPNFGFDSGFHMPNSIIDQETIDTGGVERHSFQFWPDSNRVILLAANRSQKQTASYGSIRLLQKTADEPTESNESGPISARLQGTETRKFMSFHEQPLFPWNFGVHDALDEQLGQPVNDWYTFYEGARRLIQHLQDTGSDGAFVNVYGEGSALMPLKSTQITPHYDSGIFSSTGNDPLRKDVVELLYQMFEREGLQFVPVLSFDHPLAAIEFAKSEHVTDTKVIDYRNFERHSDAAAGDGTTGDAAAAMPAHNPLSPKVQEAITAIVEEIASRYRNRESWRGLAIACRPDTCTLLPGSRIAGYDAVTIARFAATIPELAGRMPASTELLQGKYRKQWLDWRNGEMSRWYRRLAWVVTADSRQAKLFLPLIDIFQNEEIASLLSPSLHHSADVASAMHRLGFSSDLATPSNAAEAVAAFNNIVLMKPERSAPIHPLALRKCDYSVQRMRQLNPWFQNHSYPANLFLHRSAWARFENLEVNSFFSNQLAPIMRLQQLNPSGVWNRERFARAILDSDARLLVDGGLLLNTCLDSGLKSFMDVYSSLPDAQFETVAHASHPTDIHPVAVRYLNTDRGTFLYLVNATPWEVSVTVKGDHEIRNDFVAFGRTDWLAVKPDEQPGQFLVKLAPFELSGGVIPNREVRFKEFRYELPATALRDLNTSYYQLRSKLTASSNAQPLNAIQNPGFEAPRFDDGWSTGEQPTDFIELQSQKPFDGTASLLIDNRQEQNVWIRSNSFAPPVTGRLSVSVWLKTRDPAIQPPLRICVESSDADSNYYRFGEVGSLAGDREQNRLTTEWKRFAVHFDDLPSEQLKGVRIGFDMMGMGDVWIDQVQVFDRWLDENDVKAMTQMLAGIGPMMQQTEKMERCRQALDSYWPTFLHEYFDGESEPAAKIAEEINQPPARSTMRDRFRQFVSPDIFQFR